MIETTFSSLVQLLTDPAQLGMIFLATLCGIFFGVVPGLGGKLGIILIIPFMIGVDPTHGLIFLVAMHAVVHTGGSIPSILFGIPGTGPDAATVIDGYPLTQQGQAGRALGASLFASAIGGIIGAVFLLCMLPILEPIVLSFSPAEFFLLAILGITMISSVSGENLRKGIIVGCFGLGMAFIGLSSQTGEPRYVFGQLFLWDGIDFVTAVLGIFAIPEMIALGVKGGAIAAPTSQKLQYRYGDVAQGVIDVFRHRWLALRTSVMGALIGMIPGLGGEAASWICYGHAVQSSKTPDRFGKGAIEGVIAPETANNSKEGGSLLPTLFFGIPGSSGMAVLLGAFVALGIQPGPQILIDEPTLVHKLIVALVLANITAAIILILVSRRLTCIVKIPGTLLIPVTFALALLGSYLSSLDWQHLLILLSLGILGYGLKYFEWPRAPFIIGLALGGIAEDSFHQALAIWGPAFFLRPLSLILLGLIAATVGFYYWRQRKRPMAGHRE